MTKTPSVPMKRHLAFGAAVYGLVLVIMPLFVIWAGEDVVFLRVVASAVIGIVLFGWGMRNL